MRQFETFILNAILLPESRVIYENVVLVRPVPDLFHYTSEAGLIGILRTRVLWASDARRLNDKTEITYAEKLIRETLDSEMPNVPPEFRRWLGAFKFVVDEVASRQRTFVASFCERGDHLGQWRGYAGAGYCLRFKGSALENLPNWLITRTVYEPDEQRRILRATLAAHLPALECARGLGDPRRINHVSGQLGAQLALYATCFKDPCWEDEHEWRGTTGAAAGAVRIRTADGRRIPYVEISLTETNDTFLPLVEVVHAPARDMRRAKSKLEAILREHGYPASMAKGSRVPLRV